MAIFLLIAQFFCHFHQAFVKISHFVKIQSVYRVSGSVIVRISKKCRVRNHQRFDLELELVLNAGSVFNSFVVMMFDFFYFTDGVGKLDYLRRGVAAG